MTSDRKRAYKPPLKQNRNGQRLANPYDGALEIKKRKSDSDFFT